jgi:hypothetical protein
MYVPHHGEIELHPSGRRFINPPVTKFILATRSTISPQVGEEINLGLNVS